MLFDLAYPGQYKRRIKSVRLTIPCVAGPVHERERDADADAEQGANASRRPARRTLVAVRRRRRTQSIATSTAQNDGGMFELSFRDERYLPFEGAGAVSTWRLELPSQLRQFDYATIADVIVTRRLYGARRRTCSARRSSRRSSTS